MGFSDAHIAGSSDAVSAPIGTYARSSCAVIAARSASC